MGLRAGTALGPYEILASIGEGGMGEVYRARDTKLGRDVAVKVLPEAFARDEERLARFRREARLLASLNHANIATIHGLEESDGVQFLVMELVDGQTLQERIAEGPIPLEEALPLFEQIADGLEAAHDKGIVHRDLKPANIKITPEGNIKILDFGLAKAFAGEDGSADSSKSPTLTRGTALGAVMGTAAYMSPEQSRGKPVDTRTDIWAFGCCLYEALTAAKVFAGETVTDILAAVVKNEPNWDALASDTPRRVRDVLRRCLQKDRRLRFHHVADVRLELLDAERERHAPVTASEGRTRLGAFALTALLASLVTALALFALDLRAPSASRPVIRSVLPLEHELSLSLTPSLAISPDGRYVAYVVQDSDTRRLHIRSLEQAQGRAAEGTEDALGPFFSPDGRWVGFHANGSLMKVSVSGGAPTRIADVGTEVIRGAHWSADGQIFFSPTSGSGLSKVSAEGGTPETVTVPNLDKREKSHRGPEVLPGGRAVVFTLGSGDITSWDDGSIAVLSLDTREYEVLIEGGMNPHYSESGHLLYARAGVLLAVPFDVDNLEVTGTPVAVLESLAMSPFGANAEVSLSRNGHLLFAPGSSRLDMHDVQLVDRQGAADTLFEAAAFSPRFSPDGRRLAMWMAGANDTVGIYDLERGIMSELVRGFDNRRPAWSPEGDRLVFSSNRSGAFNLYVQAADGSTPPERLTTSDYTQYPGSWSPDAQWVAFSEERPDASEDLWVLSLENDGAVEPFVRSSANESDPQFSPDGKWIAYVSDETGRFEIHVRSFGGSGQVWQASSDGGTIPRWNRSGRELFYRSGRQIMVVAVEPEGDLFLSRPKVLLEPSSLNSFDVSPDGRRFAITEVSEDAKGPTELNLVLNWAEELKRLVPTEK